MRTATTPLFFPPPPPAPTASTAIARFCRAALVLLAVVPALVFAAQPVRAHTILLSSDPPEGGTVSANVSTITLTFDENPQPGFSKVTIYDTKQRPVTTSTAPETGPTPNTLIVPVPTLGTDGYALVWQILSTDGHVARGAYTFTVQLPGEAKAAPPPELSTVLSASANNPPTLAVLLAAVRYAGLGALVGGAGVLLLCVLPALAALPEGARRRARLLLDRRAQRWLFVAFGAVLAAHLLILLTQAAKATNSGLTDALRYDLLNDLVRQTTFGAVWRVQTIALLLLGEWLVLLPATGRVRLPALHHRGVGITAHPPQTAPVTAKADAEPVPMWAWGVALAGGLFLLGTTAFGGHAAAVVAHPALALLSDWTHLAAMSLWFGGVLLLIGLLPDTKAGASASAEAATGRRVTSDAMSRFSRLAVLAIGVVTISGIYNATQHTSTETLTTTGYGLALVGKVALVACVLLAAAVNRWLVVPALHKDMAGDGASAGWAQTLLLRLVGAEVLLGLGVIGLTGLLTQLPPAYKPAPLPVTAAAAAVAGQSEVVASVPTLTLDDVRATLDVNARGSDVEFAARVTDTANRPRPDVERVVLLLDSGDRDIGTITVPMARADDGRYLTSGGWFSNGQHWLARVVVARTGTTDTTLNFALLPRPVPRASTTGAANAFPWPRFEAAAGIGAVLALLGLALALATRYAPVPFGARERQAYAWGGVGLIVAGVIVVGWFSAVAAPLLR